MSRVYLFALMPGSDRPTVQYRSDKVGGIYAPPNNLRDFVSWLNPRPGSKIGGILCSGLPLWLVECADAEAGRRCIAIARCGDHYFRHLDDARFRNAGAYVCSTCGASPEEVATPPGRILDSGGARAEGGK